MYREYDAKIVKPVQHILFNGHNTKRLGALGGNGMKVEYQR